MLKAEMMGEVSRSVGDGVRYWASSSPDACRRLALAPATINPGPGSVHLEDICAKGDTITLVLRTHRPTADCPVCGWQTDPVYSWYQRTLADLLWHDRGVRLFLHTRR